MTLGQLFFCLRDLVVRVQICIQVSAAGSNHGAANSNFHTDMRKDGGSTQMLDRAIVGISANRVFSTIWGLRGLVVRATTSSRASQYDFNC